MGGGAGRKRSGGQPSGTLCGGGLLLASLRHLVLIRASQDPAIHPVRRKLDKCLEVLNVLFIPEAQVVGFVIPKPCGPFGAGLDIGVFELVRRADGEKRDLPIEHAAETIVEAVLDERF